jgi:glutamate carboxypeptidase
LLAFTAPLSALFFEVARMGSIGERFRPGLADPKELRMENSAQRLRSYITQHRREIIDFLANLIRLESPTVSPASQEAVFHMMAEPLRRIGYRTQLLPGKISGGQLYARPFERRQRQPCQLLLGHSDTVWPVGTLKEMPVEVNSRIMKGPGVYDMKAGLTQIIFALTALHDLNIRPALTPVVFISSDEEWGSEESLRKIRLLARRVNRVLIPEPSSGPEGKLKTARKGVAQFNIIIKGKAAHAGLEPDSGVSVVRELPHLIQELTELNEGGSGVTVNIGTVQAGSGPNIVPDRCELKIDVRVPSQQDAIRVETTIRNLRTVQEGATIRVEGGMERPPMERTPRNRVLWQMARSLAADLDIVLEEDYTGGGSDGNLTSPFTATLDGLGGVGGGAHARHEYVYLQKLLERTSLMALLLTAPAVPQSAVSSKVPATRT